MPDLDAFGPLPDLVTDRLLLRNLSTDDAQDMFEYASDPRVAAFTAWTAHESIEDSRTFLKMTVTDNANAATNQWTWGIIYKQSNKLVGTCFLSWSPQHARAVVGYALGYLYWGQGLMTEVVREVIRFGFERMNLNRIEALCLPENIGSARVMEKAGMTYEGTLRERMLIKGNYWDMKIYSILRREFASGQ
jgi:ribosomal-protein-alanine N-acetyltransferase